MAEAKHTTTPWHVYDCEPYQETKVFKSGRTVVGGEDSDQAVAYCDYITPQIAEANAQLIVTAVNERSALLKCEEALRMMRDAAIYQCAVGRAPELRRTADDKLKSAINAAQSALSLLDEARNGI